MHKEVIKIAAEAMSKGFTGDLTKTPAYRDFARKRMERYRKDLLEMGYDPDTDFDLCDWLVHHWENDD